MGRAKEAISDWQLAVSEAATIVRVKYQVSGVVAPPLCLGLYEGSTKDLRRKCEGRACDGP